MCNNLLHDKVPAPVESTKVLLQSYILSLEQIRSEASYDMLKGKRSVEIDGTLERKGSRVGEPVPWPPSPVGWFVVSLDGSFNTCDNTIGASMVVRYSKGSHIASACWYIPHCTNVL